MENGVRIRKTERRQDVRYPFVCEVESLLPKNRKRERSEPHTIRGRLVNISLGGVCVIADRLTERASVLAFRLRVRGVPVSMPVLAQVQWVRPVPSRADTFSMGLRFLV